MNAFDQYCGHRKSPQMVQIGGITGGSAADGHCTTWESGETQVKVGFKVVVVAACHWFSAILW